MFKSSLINIGIVILSILLTCSSSSSSCGSSPVVLVAARGANVVVGAAAPGAAGEEKKSSLSYITHSSIRYNDVEEEDSYTVLKTTRQEGESSLVRNLIVNNQDYIRHKISESMICSPSTTTTARTPLEPSHRQLELSEECQQELNQIAAANITLSVVDETTIFNITESDVEKFCSTNIQKRTITCDYTKLFNSNNTEVFRASCQSAGGVIDYFKMKIFLDDLTFADADSSPVTIVFNNIPSCIGPSCDRKEYIDYVQLLLDDQQGNSSSVLDGYSIEFSAGYNIGRATTVVAGTAVLVLVTFLLQ